MSDGKLTAYELQVLIGTTISGCNMSPDRTFDLKAAWARLYGLGLIDRTDGLAIATDKGVAHVAAVLSPQQFAESAKSSAEPVTSNPSPNMDLVGLLDRAGISVKPLEWAERSGGAHAIARSVVGIYTINVTSGGRYQLNRNYQTPADFFPSREEAEAAAQADYEARILSSLKAST